jgi:hypothetical protein
MVHPFHTKHGKTYKDKFPVKTFKLGEKFFYLNLGWNFFHHIWFCWFDKWWIMGLYDVTNDMLILPFFLLILGTNWQRQMSSRTWKSFEWIAHWFDKFMCNIDDITATNNRETHRTAQSFNKSWTEWSHYWFTRQ